MKNSLRIHKWTHNEFNIFILGVLTRPLHSWYQGAALLVPRCCSFLVPFFQFVYRQCFQVPDLFIFREIDESRLREISVQLNIREFFFEH